MRTHTLEGAAAVRGANSKAERRAGDRSERRRLRGRLNLFQAMVLRWRELHPYVAVHMVGVPHRLESARLKEHIGERLEAAGLARIALDPERKRFEFRPGPASIDLTVLSGGDDPGAVARAEIERQLNGAFPGGGVFTPFRFFAVDAGTQFDLGVAYDHFIAGGDSIAVLLERLVEGYVPAPQPSAAWSPRRYPRTYARLFLRDFIYALRGLPRLRAMTASCRRSLRPPCSTDEPAANGFLALRVSEQDFSAMRRAAKSWHVTVNDLLLAMLLRSLAAVLTRRGGERNEIGVASIVNLRGEFESDANDTFGLFLASLRIAHPVPAGIELKTLAEEVHAETERIKKEKLYLQTLLGLGWTAMTWGFLTPERRRKLLAKHYPIWAGLTSLNIDALWSDNATSRASRDYVRAVPTGPLAPLAFAITTFHGAMQVGVSYRVPDMSAETAQRIAAGFVDQVRRLA
jgi:hypothetical protein